MMNELSDPVRPCQTLSDLSDPSDWSHSLLVKKKCNYGRLLFLKEKIREIE